jgi:pimeloyl-ACP methyl ester carboxylesterase
MPVVLVHGNPETAAVWEDLIPLLEADEVIALSPPGFGAPVPEGFGATTAEYVAWLAGELQQIAGPIDLVGHDWGAGHVMGVVNVAPDLVRSWVSDIAGALDPEYVWHDLAQAWQTPDVGEAAVAAMVDAPMEARAGIFVSNGARPELAEKLASGMDAEMGRCILPLYRSAAQPAMAEFGADLSGLASKPGLVIIASEDNFTGGEALARRTAERAGAQVAVLEGVGHWWMLQDSAAGAAALNAFWASLEQGEAASVN